MRAKPLRSDLVKYLERHGLKRKFSKQKKLFCENPRYTSLHTEILEPKSLKLYSFRIDQKYRAVFILIDAAQAEIVDITSHYQ